MYLHALSSLKEVSSCNIYNFMSSPQSSGGAGGEIIVSIEVKVVSHHLFSNINRYQLIRFYFIHTDFFGFCSIIHEYYLSLKRDYFLQQIGSSCYEEKIIRSS